MIKIIIFYNKIVMAKNYQSKLKANSILMQKSMKHTADIFQENKRKHYNIQKMNNSIILKKK